MLEQSRSEEPSPTVDNATREEVLARLTVIRGHTKSLIQGINNCCKAVDDYLGSAAALRQSIGAVQTSISRLLDDAWALATDDDPARELQRLLDSTQSVDRAMEGLQSLLGEGGNDAGEDD